MKNKTIIIILCISLILHESICQGTTKPQGQISQILKPNPKQLIVDYGAATIISNIVDGMANKQKYYVQIGSYDPIYKSNTLGLDILGWKGVNVLSLHARLRQFYELRHHQVNLNYLIGSQAGFANINYYEKNLGDIVKPYTQTEYGPDKPTSPGSNQSVSQITLGDLCKKHYQRRPSIVIINNGNNPQQILQSNNWTDEKCIPDMFIIASPQSSASQPGTNLNQSYNSLLTQKKYTKSAITHQKFQFFFKNELMVQYTSNYERNSKAIASKDVVKFPILLGNIGKILKVQIEQDRVGFGAKSGVILHFVHKNQLISLYQLNQKLQWSQGQRSPSASPSPQKPTPIILLNFNPFDNALVLQNCNFKVNKIEAPSLNLNLINIQAQHDKRKIQIYIVDQLFGAVRDWQPQLMIMDEKCRNDARTGEYKDVHENQYKYRSRVETLKSGQVGPPSKQFNFQDFIFQVIFTIIFATFFLTFAVSVFIYWCIALQNQRKIQKENLFNLRNNQSGIVSSVFRSEDIKNDLDKEEDEDVTSKNKDRIEND